MTQQEADTSSRRRAAQRIRDSLEFDKRPPAPVRPPVCGRDCIAAWLCRQRDGSRVCGFLDSAPRIPS